MSGKASTSKIHSFISKFFFYFCLSFFQLLKTHHGNISGTLTKPVITIGNFDGVHLGHRSVIDSLKHIAAETGGESVIITLWPHPRIALGQHAPDLRYLSTLSEKQALLTGCGVDHLVVLPFDRTFASLTYLQFIEQYLVQRMGVHTLVLGHDHTLGRNREGTFDKVVEASCQFGFRVRQLEAVQLDDADISSSKIRRALLVGDIAKGNACLGYHYFVTGEVTRGRQLGRLLGYPTANLRVSESNKLIPADGVYAVRAQTTQGTFGGMLNIGHRPTIQPNPDAKSIEAHLFDFSGDLYGKQLKISFVARIRDEQKFENIDALVAQLKTDEEIIRKMV